jgi:hypothetical protein
MIFSKVLQHFSPFRNGSLLGCVYHANSRTDWTQPIGAKGLNGLHCACEFYTQPHTGTRVLGTVYSFCPKTAILRKCLVLRLDPQVRFVISSFPLDKFDLYQHLASLY